MERFLEWLKTASTTVVEFIALYIGKVSHGDLAVFAAGLSLAVLFGVGFRCGFWAVLIVLALTVAKSILFKWLGRAYYLRELTAATLGSAVFAVCLLFSCVLFG